MADSQFDFSHLDIANETREFPLPFTSGAVLIVRPATDANPDYWTPYIARVLANASVKPAEDADVEAIDRQAEKTREDDNRELFPGTVVVGWRNVRNKHGDEVEFSIEACREMLAQLPSWLFVRLQQFVSLPSSFIKAKTLAGN
jgi:hypothetical protein